MRVLYVSVHFASTQKHTFHHWMRTYCVCVCSGQHFCDCVSVGRKRVGKPTWLKLLPALKEKRKYHSGREILCVCVQHHCHCSCLLSLSWNTCSMRPFPGWKASFTVIITEVCLSYKKRWTERVVILWPWLTCRAYLHLAQLRKQKCSTD